jgi:hypothetical protein
MIFSGFLSVGQEPFLDHRHVITGQYTGMTEIPLPFARFFCQNMTKVLFFVFHLPCTGKRITLGGAFLGLHLGHTAIPLLNEIEPPEIRPPRGLFFGFGAQYHGHKPAFHGRIFIHNIFPLDTFQYIFQDIQSEFRVGQFPAPEADRNLTFVTFRQKILDMLGLEIQIMLVNLRLHTDFF